MRFVYILVLLISLGAFVFSLSCDDDPSEPSGLGGNDDDDDDDTGGDMYSDECSIDYGDNPGCDADDPACQMTVLMNKDRYLNPDESDCAPALDWHAELAAVALAHSQDMCNRDFFDHSNPDGDDPFDRMDAAGIQWVTAGENIFRVSGVGVDEAVTMGEEAFMDEPECVANHRSNILNRNFTHVGVGVYECGDGYIYITQDFAAFSFGDIRQDPHEYCPGFSK
jgi:hypothetical protein